MTPNKREAIYRLKRELDRLAVPLRDPEPLREIVAELMRVLIASEDEAIEIARRVEYRDYY